MTATPIDSDEVLAQALSSLSDKRFSERLYKYETITGGTQAAVWRGVPSNAASPVIALRLTPKPIELIRRIAAVVDSISTVECPQTLGMSSAEVDGRTFTVQVCTWIGSSTYPMSDMRLLGRCLASLHTELQRSSQDFSDRRLSFERAELPASMRTDQALPSWYVARHVWRERILVWLHLQTRHLPNQPIHGDMHWANIVPTAGGFGFIDFDKVMWAPPVFDLAKLIATGFFTIGSQVRFRARRAAKLLEGYNTMRRLSEKEVAALEGLALLLNEETARLGMVYGIDEYRDRAAAVASWWIARRRRRVWNPLGIRGLFDPIPTNPQTERQLALWSEHDTRHYLDSR